MFNHFHPYKPFIKKDTKRIIVGTLSPPRFCTREFKKADVDFCYGSADGLLWKTLDRIFSLDLVYEQSLIATNQRKDFLVKNKLGVCDIVNSCKREKIDASDLGMRDIELRDILGYLKEYENIDTLIFTGGNSKNGPEFFFRQILKKEKITLVLENKNLPKVHMFIFENKEYKTISLTSPSNAANRSIGANSYYKEQKQKNVNYSTFDFRVEQYKKVFISSNKGTGIHLLRIY